MKHIGTKRATGALIDPKINKSSFPQLFVRRFEATSVSQHIHPHGKQPLHVALASSSTASRCAWALFMVSVGAHLNRSHERSDNIASAMRRVLTVKSAMPTPNWPYSNSICSFSCCLTHTHTHYNTTALSGREIEPVV